MMRRRWSVLLNMISWTVLSFFALLCLRSFTGEMFPHPTQIWFFPHHFPPSSPIRLLFHNLPPLHFCQWFFSFCLQLTTTDASCNQLRVFSLHCLSQRNKALAERSPRSVRRSSLPPLHAPYSFLLSHNPVFLRIPPELLFSLEQISSPSLGISLPLELCIYLLVAAFAIKVHESAFHRIRHDNYFRHFRFPFWLQPPRVSASCRCNGGGHTQIQGRTASGDSSGGENISRPGLRSGEPSGFRSNAQVCKLHAADERTHSVLAWLRLC